MAVVPSRRKHTVASGAFSRLTATRRIADSACWANVSRFCDASEVHIPRGASSIEAEDTVEQNVPRSRTDHEVIERELSRDPLNEGQDLERHRSDGTVTRDGEHHPGSVRGSALRP